MCVIYVLNSCLILSIIWCFFYFRTALLWSKSGPSTSTFAIHIYSEGTLYMIMSFIENFFSNIQIFFTGKFRTIILRSKLGPQPLVLPSSSIYDNRPSVII